MHSLVLKLQALGEDACRSKPPYSFMGRSRLHHQRPYGQAIDPVYLAAIDKGQSVGECC